MESRDDRTLSLLHLRKTFSEYLKIPVSGARNNDPSRLLPLFHKVMSMYNAQELATEFKEIVHFATFLCSVLVKEVRQRAASSGTIEAAQSISEYLEPGQQGWPILESIRFLLSSDDEVMINAACKVSLPSTLVKTIYLFFDLPMAENPESRREELYEMMASIMEELCKFKCVSEELVRKDDLLLLFVGTTSQVSDSNNNWRKLCAKLLEVIADKSLTNAIIKYVVVKKCVRIYVKNLSLATLDAQKTAEAIICLACFLKNSGYLTDQLLQEFYEADGYTMVKDFLLRNEHDEELVRNILIMTISLITSGKFEIQPQWTSGLVQLPMFSLPQPIGNGTSVRNLNAFSMLYHVFIESSNEQVSCTVIDILQSIYTCDHANYFILDREYPLSIFIDQLERKTMKTRVKLLELIEFAVFQLSHIPCRELISLCVLLKTEISNSKTEMCTLIVQMCFKLITVDAIIKDAFREVGLLDSLCYIIRRMHENRGKMTQECVKLSLLTTDLLTIIIKNNIENGKLFTECFGARLLVEIIADVDEEWRSSLLQLLKQLLIIAPTDQYIVNVVNILNEKSPLDHLDTMFSLLKALLGVVRESHKVRIQFRKSGGFLALCALILGLEKKFENVKPDEIGRIPKEFCEILEFLHLIFKVFTLSMRFEPSNAKYFGSEISWDSISSLLRLTSIFNENTVVSTEEPEWKTQIGEIGAEISACHEVFKMDDNIEAGNVPSGMPFKIYFGCYIIRLIFNMALDNYEKMQSDIKWTEDTLEDSIVTWTSSILVHPGAIISMLSLLPAIGTGAKKIDKWTVSAQYYVSLLLKTILKSERNQQIMCQIDMPKYLLEVSTKLFQAQPDHLLLQPFYYLLERLSYQSLTPNQLRQFLRLDNPLCCRSFDEEVPIDPSSMYEGGPVPLQRVKALVSMMTPRDQQIGTAPSFVEFDMSIEGFAAIYLPTLAPIFSTPTKSERIFPPLNGFSYCAWIHFDTLSDKKQDPHPIRLLTITRAVSGGALDLKKGGQSHLACFQVQFSAIDRSILISTDENEQPGADLEKSISTGTEKTIRVCVADIVRVQEWFHLAVIFNRSVLKSSMVSVYLNGRHVATQKLVYISQNAGGGASQLAQTQAVNAVVGTLPALRRPSRLRFRMASIFLAEEPMSAEVVRQVYMLQPHYIGNFQTVERGAVALVQEEKIVFSLSAAATQELTLAKIRAMYGKIEAEILSQHLGISPNDHSTPLRILTNTVSHAPGPGRTFGGVIVGYLGMRTFTPRPVPSLLDSIGGFACIYGLIAMAVDSEGLYASLKSLVSAIRSNPKLLATLNNNRSYQILAVLLEDKSKMLNSHIMHMVFNVTGTADTSKEHATIPNPPAFEDLLCDLKVWKSAPIELHKMLFEHFYELITDHQINNLQIVRRSSLLSRLLLTIYNDPIITQNTDDIVFNLISAILQPPCDTKSILKIGQIIGATLNSTSEVEEAPFHISELQKIFLETSMTSSTSDENPIHMIYIRNRLLNMISNFLSNSNSQIQATLADQIVKVLGFDWLFALMTPGVHSGTLYLGLRILLLILNQPAQLAKFKEGTSNGGWLSEADSVVRNRAAVVLGFSVSANSGSVGSKIDINPEIATCGGFGALEHLMAAHAEKPWPYYAMLSVLVGQPISNLRYCDQFNMELVWTHVFGLSSTSSVFEAINGANFCFDALIPLFSMCRAAIYSETSNSNTSTVVQMITFMYQNSAAFFQIAHTDEFILALFSALIQDTNSMGQQQQQRKVMANDFSPDPEYFQTFLAQPNVKMVMDLLKKVVCDDLQVNSSKNDTIIDVLLDNIAENGLTRKTQIACLTTLIHSTLEHVVATDLLTSSALPPTQQTQPVAQIIQNISNLTSRAVDGYWNGLINQGESIRMLSTLYHLQALVAKKGVAPSSGDMVVNGVMRITLFILSRPIDCVPVQLAVLDALSSLVSKRYLFLATNETWFYASLTHLIFMLSVTPDVLFVDTSSDLDRTSAQVALCASRVWTDLILPKQALIEEVFKRPTVSEINASRALLAHAAGVHWQQFVDSQLRSSCSFSNSASATATTKEMISSRINKVASGISRFAAARSLSVSTVTQAVATVKPWKSSNSVDANVIFMWLKVHISLIKELLRAQTSRYDEWHAHVRKWCLHDWHQCEAELTRERGIWGPERASKLEKFKLDLTEGPTRIRRKLIPNRNFYHLYPYRPHLDVPTAKAQRAKVAISHDSKIYYEQCVKFRKRTLDMRIIDSNVTVSTPSEEKANLLIYTSFTDLSQINSSLIRRLSTTVPTALPTSEVVELNEEEELDDQQPQKKEESPENSESSTSEAISQNKPQLPKPEEEKKPGPDNQTLLRLLEQGEQLHSMFRCARIQGLETAEGLLLFGRDHFYVVDGFTLLKTKEIRDLDFLSSDMHDPIVPYPATGATQPPKSSRLCSKFSYNMIREVHKRRYLLQPIALEVFSSDGRNYLLAFPKKIRDRVFDKLTSMATRLSDKVDLLGSQKVGGALLNSLIGQQSVTQKWLNGSITNFQYLMHLNTLAGRCYNDLSQYPIFPWVVKDYQSGVLDFTNPAVTFRDLSKPMGAQTPDRLEQFLKRYREWDDPSGETPPYMYGTHYSSAMIVVSYLVRLEPFTGQFLSLQGGHFDLADRMFHSVGDAWQSASKNNMADVKELIPEFFTLPEMFENGNAFDLGVKQNGTQVNDVVLPTWALGDAREFVRCHRQALESDYVSSHLHEWIDLIFGYKQNGEESIKANNLFHHLFYEGSVDFERIDDPLTRNATIGFVNNFGQIPTQLFKKPHAQKKVNIIEGYSNTPGVTTPRLFYHAIHNLTPPQTPFKELRSAVGSINQNDKIGVVALEQNKVLLTGSNRFVTWGLPDRSVRIGQIDSDKSVCIHEMCEVDEMTCVAAGDEWTLFYGNTSGCITVWNVNTKPLAMKKVAVLNGHSDAVTCLVSCQSHAVLISASRDSTVLIWHLSEMFLIRQLPKHPQPVVAVAVNDSTGDIATASSTILHVWTMNGQLLAKLNTCDVAPTIDAQQMIISLAFSTMNEWDNDNVIMCGTADGCVKIYSCVMVENDGSINTDDASSYNTLDGTGTTSKSTVIAARLEKQRRRLKGGGGAATLTSSDSATSSEPASPKMFPIETKNSVGEVETQQHPKFVRVLIQRTALTMHTAFNRPDNVHPAPITAIAPSRDHKCLYIGDGIGRVWCWQSGEAGGRADHWVQDVTRQRCDDCEHKFSLADRKHHCRNCGQIFCSSCSRFESHITRMNISRPVRVCRKCFLRLQQNS